MKGKITIFAVLGFIAFFAMEARAVDWVLFAEAEGSGNIHYYDPQNIKLVSKDIVQVWAKEVFTEKGVQEHIKKLRPEYKELSYDICLYEFNCNEKKFRILSVIDYNKKGTV